MVLLQNLVELCRSVPARGVWQGGGVESAKAEICRISFNLKVRGTVNCKRRGLGEAVSRRLIRLVRQTSSERSRPFGDLLRVDDRTGRVETGHAVSPSGNRRSVRPRR